MDSHERGEHRVQGVAGEGFELEAHAAGRGRREGLGAQQDGSGRRARGNNNAVPSKAGAGKAISGGSGATVVRLNLLPEDDDAVLEG